jgi:competence ComEA-like helix-hairpin-helix protein
MDAKININTSGPKQLTQLPGVAKNLAYSIVSHRERHGSFTHWEELAEVKGFPADAIDRIKQRATLAVPGEVEVGTSPRRLKATHSTRTAKRCWLFEEDPKHQEVRQAETLRLTSVHAAQALGVGVCAREAWLHLVQKHEIQR